MKMLPVQRPEFDAIYWQTVGKHMRTICIAGANTGEGVSALSLALARRGAAAGLNVLLVDANLPRPSISAKFGLQPTRWTLADGTARAAVRPVQAVKLGILSAPTGIDPLSFRDPESWRRLLDEDLADYDLIVIDSSAVNSFNDKVIPAEAIAAACTATVLVILAGVTSERSVRTAIERLAGAGALLSGVVFNDHFNPRLADELCREVDCLAGLTPRFCRWLQRWIRGSAILNLQN